MHTLACNKSMAIIVQISKFSKLENYKNECQRENLAWTRNFSQNWYIFIRTKSFLPTMANAADDDLETGGANAVPSSHYEEKQYVGSTGAATTCISARGSSDTIPLLVNAENCTEMRELRLDYISTISN